MSAFTYIKGKRVNRTWYVAVSNGQAWASGSGRSFAAALEEASHNLTMHPVFPDRTPSHLLQ